MADKIYTLADFLSSKDDEEKFKILDSLASSLDSEQVAEIISLFKTYLYRLRALRKLVYLIEQIDKSTVMFMFPDDYREEAKEILFGKFLPVDGNLVHHTPIEQNYFRFILNKKSYILH